jgi:transposase
MNLRSGSLKILHLYFEEGMDYRSISKILPVSFASVGYWIRAFAQEYKSKTEIMKAISRFDGTSPDESKISKGNADAGTSKDTVSLEAELASLREELKYQRLRADAYDEMINVAEEQFDIKIRKKAGAKQ